MEMPGAYDAADEAPLEEALDQGDYNAVLNLLNDQYVRIMGEDVAARMKQVANSLPPDVAKDNLWVNVGGAVACEMLRSYDSQRGFIDNALRIAREGGLDENGADLGSSDLATHGDPFGLDADRGNAVRMAVCILHMLDHYHRGYFDEVIRRGEDELEHLGNQDHYAKSGILCLLGMAHWACGNAAKAHGCWRMGANFAMFGSWIYSLCLEQFGTAVAHYAQNQLTDAAEICRRIFAISDQGGAPVLASCYAHLLMARINYDRNNLPEARAEVDRACRIAEAGPENTLYLDAETAYAHIDVARGDVESATERANRCMASFAWTRQREGLEGARSMMASIWTHAGMPRMASDCLDMYWDFDLLAPLDKGQQAEILQEGLFGSDFRNVWSAPPIMQLLRLRIREENTAGVMMWLERIGREAVSRGLSRLLLETLVLKALCAHVEEDDKTALDYLSVSLIIAESEQCIRVYADEGPQMEELLVAAHRARMSSLFMDRVFAAVRGESLDAEPVEASFGETFTKRELDVMRQLYGGATNAEIAQRLYLGLSTVKNYTHRIYQKLGVRNRAEAIVRIGQLGIMD